MKLQLTALGFIALAAATMPGTAQADPVNLVQNGSFSSTTLNGSGQVKGSNVTDWTTTSGYTFLYTPIAATAGQSEAGLSNNGTGVALYGIGNNSHTNGYVPLSPDGGNFLAADSAYSVGTLAQTLVGLVTGATYAVTFYQAAGQQTNFNGNTTDIWTVGLGDSYQNAPTQDRCHSRLRQLGADHAGLRRDRDLRSAVLHRERHPRPIPAALRPARRRFRLSDLPARAGAAGLCRHAGGAARHAGRAQAVDPARLTVSSGYG